MSGGEVSTHPTEEEREGTPGGEDPEKSNNKGGSKEGLSETVKALVKATVGEELAKLKAGSGTEHPSPSGSLRNPSERQGQRISLPGVKTRGMTGDYLLPLVRRFG